jgi:hypothetical protein
MQLSGCLLFWKFAMKISPRFGAVVFLLWGVVHALGGATFIYVTSQQGSAAALGMMASALGEVSAGTGTDVEALLLYHFFNIAWLGLVAIAISLTLNWKNSVTGFWINVAIVAFADLGLLVFMLLPGLMQWKDGAIGLVLGVAAIALSWLAVPGRAFATGATQHA